MKALVLQAPDQFPVLTHFTLDPEPGQVSLKLLASALNHRDVWICKGLYPGIKYPMILGSDGVGQVEGRTVVINPGHSWGPNESFQGPEYAILGLPGHGTFAEEIMVNPEYLHDKPAHLSDEQAAALPLAGLTAYRALFVKARPGNRERVLISGTGGGVALFALQFAVAAGLEVFVTSGSEWKIEKAISLGAKGGVNYHKPDWPESLKKMGRGGFDVIVDGAGGKGFASFIKLANPGGRIVVYGGTHGAVGPLNTQLIFWKQLSILGSTMGSDQDFRTMLEFVTRHKIVPVVDHVFSFAESQQAFERMASGSQFGKIVFKNQ